MPSLRTLDPAFRPFAERFFRKARKVAPGVVVTSSRRTYQEQLRLYQAAQRGENNGLPANPPGTSSHETGLAWDMARPWVDPLSDPGLRALGAMWQAEGGTWWSGDPVHFAASAGLLARRRKRRRLRR